MRFWAAAGLALAATVGATVAAAADETVKIGALYPLTGASASAGNRAKAAIEIAANIVNSPHQGLENLPLGSGTGLPNLKDAKLDVIFADDQGNPSVGQSQVLRLASHDKVAALIGAGRSPVALAASAAAERRGVPFLVPDAAAPDITGRGFKWVFRTTPTGADFAKVYVQFLTERKQAGDKVDSIAFVARETARAAAVSGPLRDAVKAAGFDVVADVTYSPDATDVAPQVQQLRDKKPDVVIFVSATADAILFIKTMKTLDYRPPMVIAAGAGFADPAFVAAVGNLAQGVIGRSVWNVGSPGSPTAIVNALFKAKTGRNLDDAGARIMQGFLVLADAINRAGSTEPAAVRQALRETDLKPDQLIVGFRGVKFDETGQNSLASSYLVQLRGKEYVPVWPAATAAAKLVLPYKGWE